MRWLDDITDSMDRSLSTGCPSPEDLFNPGIRLQFGRPGFDPWVGKVTWRRERIPTPVLWPGEFHGLYSAWGRKESDTTEQVSLSHFLSFARYKII